VNLKEGAIYQLPNGRELVAHRTSGRIILNNLTMSESGQYELNSEGRLLLNGRLTAWGLADLLETGRVISQDAAAVLLETRAGDKDERSI